MSAIIGHPLGRAIVTVVVLIWALRLYSYLRTERRSRGGWQDFLAFMSIGTLTPHLVYSRSRSSTDQHIGLELARVGIGSAIAYLGFIFARQLLMTDAAKQSWLVNHLLLLGGFVVVMQSAGHAMLGAWRLMGLRAPRPIAHRILLSRTPADFWRRWSWSMHLWLYRYVYLPAGGSGRFARAVLLTFFVSAVLHELIVLGGFGRVTGHQSAYFMMNGLGVLASPRLERLATSGLIGNVLARTITITFLAATAPLMFATFQWVLPVYHRPGWLAW